jgi:hypothetical protein
MIRLVLTTVLAWLFLSTATMAETGLERFEREIKPQIELQSFTYKGAETLGDTGFVLNEVVAVMPASAAIGDKESTLRIDKARIRLEGLTGDEDMFALLDPYGIPRVPMDVILDYRLDGAEKVFMLNALEIALRGQGRIGLTLVIDGVGEKSSEMVGAKDDGRLRTASLTLDDKGLIGKLLPAIAKEQGQSAEAFVAFALVSIATFCEGQGPATVKALDAVASFVADWQAPKGALVIGLKPAKTARLSDFDKIMEPNALVDIFGLTATYAGTRDGAATANRDNK